MKLSMFLAAMLVVFASMAVAAPLCTDLVGTGAAGAVTMADYVALGGGGCQIGDKLFSNFFYQPTHAGEGPAVAASSIFMAPVNPTSYNPGIVFSSNDWLVSGGVSYYDASISFGVTVLGGGSLIEDATLTMGADATVSGTGSAAIGESIVAGDGFTPLGALNVDAGSGRLVDHVIFAPSSTVEFSKNFRIGTSGAGTARVFSFTENFSEAPEPVGTILIGSGLLVLGAWRRRVTRG